MGSREISGATFNIANGDVAGLKAAITASTNNGQDDFINLAAGGLYTLTTVDNTTDGDNGLPVILSEFNHRLTINGNGARIERSTAAAVPTFRILYLARGPQHDGAITADETTLNDLTISSGAAVGDGAGDLGGGIFIGDGSVLLLYNCVLTGNFASRHGGAIFVDGNAFSSLNYCTLSNNEGHQGGGGIYNTATLDVLDSTFSGNSSGTGPGGALYNNGGSVVAVASMTNCTFDNNTRIIAGGTTGGGIFNVIFTSPVGADNSHITLTHCTLNHTDVLNSGQYTGGPAPSGLITLRANIFASSAVLNDTNPGHNRVEIRSEGYNLSSDDGGGNLTGPNDQINKDAKLDPAGLQNNGGATATIALLADSPALDHAIAFGVNLDQRDQFRPRDLAFAPDGPGTDGSDVGAFEAADARQGASTLIVNTVADHDDGVCSGSDCTLREAILAANAATDANTISFTAGLTGTIDLASALGQLVVNNPVAINGPGARVLAVSGGNSTRIFNFVSGTSMLSGLTIRDGLFQASSSSIGAAGGGLSNSGTLTVNDCSFVGNRVIGGNNITGGIFGTTGGSGRGGAISNIEGGTLMLNRSTFAGNSAVGGRGFNNTGSGVLGGTGGIGQGGAVINESAGTLVMNNCTFANNAAAGGVGGNNTSTDGRGGIGGAGIGAAILNRESATATACTIAGNAGVGGAGGQGDGPRNNADAGSGGGAIENIGASVFTVRNTISAGNTGNSGRDAKGSFVSQDFNLIGIGDFASGFNGTSDQLGSFQSPLNAMLDSLANRGGPTDTMALLDGSPAVDAGKSFGLAVDQRGLARPKDVPNIPNANGGDGSDIGALERQNLMTASGVTISGRVLTSYGRGLKNAVVTITDPSGTSRTTLVRPGGSYSFTDVEAGRSYVISVASKRFSFTPRIVFVRDNIGELDLTAVD